jgi:hypothetical protein
MAAVFTVYFEGTFWVGVLESEERGRLIVARHVFGSEPSNVELLDFMLYRFAFLPRSGALSDETQAENRIRSPKRASREVMRDIGRPPSTKAQAALKAAREETKAERASISREEKLALCARRFELRTEKRKKKHAGH